MAIEFPKGIRRVVPRWHTFSEAIRSQELDPSELGNARKAETSSFLIEKENQWIANKELFFALDLMNAATVLGNSEHAKDAAKFVLSQKAGVSAFARDLASNMLGIAKAIEAPTVKLTREELRVRIKVEKERRKVEPRNAFIWAELARLYVLMGMPEQARRPMDIALLLAPENRFVVRSATRFFLHAGDPGRALDLLRHCTRTPSDPWLLAAEVAVSSVMKKSPRFARLGESLLGDAGVNPLHSSELSAALASVELWNGNDKKARRLFYKTLEAPNENALAQAIWAADELSLPNVQVGALNIANAFEAKALDAQSRGDWGIAIKQCDKWAGFESFSSRPYAIASCITSSLLKKHADAIEIARGGLRTNPNHPGLLNNIAFSAAEAGEPKLALEEIGKVKLDQTDLSSKICLIATAGLIEFRSSNPTEGRELYEKAISFAGIHNYPKLKATAQLYLARELARIGQADYGELLDTGSKELNLGNDTFSKALVRVLREEIAAFASQKIVSATK